MDFNNGGKWLNRALIQYRQDRIQPVMVTCSRPYPSEDNAPVEQENWTRARQLPGWVASG